MKISGTVTVFVDPVDYEQFCIEHPLAVKDRDPHAIAGAAGVLKATGVHKVLHRHGYTLNPKCANEIGYGWEVTLDISPEAAAEVA